MYECFPLLGHISFSKFIHYNEANPETGTSKIAKLHLLERLLSY